METVGKSRQNVASVKKQASLSAHRARYLARTLHVDDKLVRKIDALEQKIQSTSLDRKTSKNFCGKEIEQLQSILADLEKQYAKNTARLGLRFCLLILAANLVVFMASYEQSIPKGMYQTNANFYIILGITTYLCSSAFLFFYFCFYKWLSIHVVYPLLARIRSSSEKANAFLHWSTVLALGSLFTLLFQRLVIALATLVPTIFSPSMSLLVLISNFVTACVQFFNSSPIVAIATFFTILAVILDLLRKIYRSVLEKF